VKQLSQRQRRFCELVVEGKPIAAAYREAGFKHDPSGGNQHKLITGNHLVKREILKLQRQAMTKHQITVDTLIEQLEEARLNAKECKQPASEISATMAVAKLCGLVVDRREIQEKSLDTMNTGEVMALLRERLGDKAPELLKLLGIEDKPQPAPVQAQEPSANVHQLKKKA
jgi:phage terminase small subunit